MKEHCKKNYSLDECPYTSRTCVGCAFYRARPRYLAKLSFMGNVSDQVVEIDAHVIDSGLNCAYCGPIRPFRTVEDASAPVYIHNIVYKYNGRREGEYYILEADLEPVFEKVDKYERIKDIVKA